jgi:crotonobetainyl-CoA:carnitine CoA-transferase CaiB-like acyl-CoA transferase
MTEVFDDPHIRQRQMLLVHDLPGGGQMRQTGIGLKLSATAGEIRHLGPYLGQHTNEVLLTLGYSQAELDRFRISNVIG